MHGSCAGDGLESEGSLVFDGWGVGAADESLCGRCEFGEAGDGEVFVIEVGVFV